MLSPKDVRKFLPNEYTSKYQACVNTPKFAAKTGQTLIALPIFSSLPDSAPAATEKESDAMEVDTPVPATEGTAAEAGTSPSPKKKFVPPIDPATGDLLPEGIVYLRLLLILANLDAGRVVEVCFFYSLQKEKRQEDKALISLLGWRLCDGDCRLN